MNLDVTQPNNENNLDWIQTNISTVKNLPEGGRMELVIPPMIDYLNLISTIGQAEKQETEFGGLYNPATRSMVIVRGFRSKDSGNHHIDLVPPRRNSDGITTNDLHWHTHPWDSGDQIRFFRDPRNTCLPSDGDNNSLLATQMIEEEAGNHNPVISITTSGGHITVSEAKGIRVDPEKLKQLGLSDDRINDIMTDLALAPEKYFLNVARDPDSKVKLKELLDKFYLDRRLDKSRTAKQKIEDFQRQAKQYTLIKSRRGVMEDASEMLAKSVYSHFPKLPSRLGDLTSEQSQAVLEMTGFSMRTIKV